MTIRSLKQGEIIYKEGTPCSNAFILLSGSVELSNAQRTQLVKAGEIFGELSLLKSEAHHETATALSEISLQELSDADVETLIDNSPPAIKKIIKGISRDVMGFAKANVAISEEATVPLTADVLLQIANLNVLKPLLEDDSINDILINGINGVFVERKGKLEKSEVQFKDDAEVYTIAERIVKAVGRKIDRKKPLVDARLLDGSRVNIIAPPLSIDGTTISIRKFSKKKITLDTMIDSKNLSPGLAEFLKLAGRCRLNMVISGGTGSGKTTLLNAISQHIDTDERIVTIEDAVELQLQQPHVIRLETRPYHFGMAQEEEVTIRDLVKNALRMRPDRIIVGEIRGAEAFDMMQAMNTGHEGSLTTLHSNHPRDALSRLENMISMTNIQIPPKSLRYQLAAALHLVIQISRMRDGHRRITHISEVVGMEGDIITMHDLFNFVTEGEDEHGKVLGQFKWSGIMPRFVRRVAYYGELPRLEKALGVKLPKSI